jgi:hypothetical protein
MPPHTNANIGPQGTSYQMPCYSDRVPSSTEQQSSPPPGTGSITQGTSRHRPAPRANIPTSQVRSSNSNKSERSDKSDKSHIREDRLTEILGTLTLRGIEMGESEKFSGETARYHESCNRYNGLMENVYDAQIKLNYLLKCTIGEAHRAIVKCVYNDDHEAALKETLGTLEKRFGTAFKVADQKIEEIAKGKEVKYYDEASLWALIDKLELCDAATKAAKGTADELWSIPNLRRILASRCPSLHGKWITRASSIERAGGKPDFGKFLVFLDEQVAEWGSLFAEKKSKPGRPFKPDHNTGYNKPVPKDSWAAEVKPQAQAGSPSSPWKFGPCDCCNTGNHGYIECPIFKSKMPQERILFISKVQKCTNCFGQRHTNRKCGTKGKCRICQGPHHSMLHVPPVSVQNQNQTLAPKEKEPLENAGMCLSPGTKERRKVMNTCPIVAVELKNPLNGETEKTYVMLDSGSEFSIIDQSLARKLDVDTTKEELTVTTLESTIHKERQVCCVTISSIDQTYVLEDSKLMLAESLPTMHCPDPQNRISQIMPI